MPVDRDGPLLRGRPGRSASTAASPCAPSAARSASSGGRGGSSTSWSSICDGGPARPRAHVRPQGPGASTSTLTAGPGRRPGAGLAPAAVPGDDRDPGVRRQHSGRDLTDGARRPGALPGRAAGRRDAARDRRPLRRARPAAVPVRAGHAVLLPGLGRALQARVGGALRAGRGVRRRPVPGAGLARPRPGRAARRPARHCPSRSRRSTRSPSTRCRSPSRLADFYAPAISPEPPAGAPGPGDRAAGAAAARAGRRHRSGSATSRWSTCSARPTATWPPHLD